MKENSPSNRFIIITGLSGSGMSSATNAFEDLGYFCVDNLPITLLSQFTKLLLQGDEDRPSLEKAALVIDIRERHFLSDFEQEIEKLQRKGLYPFILFFEASDDVLMRRFSETRRPHPFDKGQGLKEAIRAEREAMQKVKRRADLIIDTSEHTVHSLRKFLLETFRQHDKEVPLRVEIISFGHKYGVPTRLDLLFDVRHLPNPYFITELRALPGNDPKVIEFLDKEPRVKETLQKFLDLVEYLLPQYKEEGKSYVTIGIGCTGGRHRSVRIAEAMAEKLRAQGYEVMISHRDILK